MQKQLKLFAIPLLAVGLAGAFAPLAHAQITNQVKATISHPFVVGNATLPPGTYTFRTIQGSDLMSMTATNDKSDTSVEFLVRESQDNTNPRHTELFFNRYGSKEFLEKIYESGNKIGVAVDEPSREELRLQKQGQHPQEHMESSND